MIPPKSTIILIAALREEALVLQGCSTQARAQGPAVYNSSTIQVQSRNAKIMRLNPMVITGEVTEKNVDQIKLGQKVDINLIDATSLQGSISYISKSANPSTRTYKIEATVSNKDGSIREGLSADMLVPLREVLAHLIPSYLISLNDEGELGVKVLIDTKVKFSKIQIVEDTVDGLWVTGLPEKATVITVGQEYVINGQIVNAEIVN